MKHVSILIPKGESSIVNIMGSYQMLAAASDTYQQQTGTALFEIDLVGFSPSTAGSPGSAVVHPTKMWQEIEQTDLIIIPAVHQDPQTVINQNQELIYFLEEQYKKGAVVASLCIGAYLLAATGLLNGKACSIHWQHANYLKALFPKIQVQEERILTEQQGVITSGGAYAFTNLIMYLVEKFGNRELAILISKLFMIDLDKRKQSVYFMFMEQKDHADEAVLQIQEYIEQHYADRFTIDQLAVNHNLVRRTLERRFKSATGNSIIEYTQKVRVESAKKELERGRKSISDVMYDCGYTDSKAFRDVFRKHVGISPLEYRKKYTQYLPL
jgi:transcriptional regulator GlxA family with amidase domain